MKRKVSYMAVIFILMLSLAWVATYFTTSSAQSTSGTFNVIPLANGGKISTANPMPVTLGTSASSPTVKAASTPSVVADKALVVALNPNNAANAIPYQVNGASGTFPSVQSGTWTVQPGNTQNTTPWLIAWPTTSGDPCQNPFVMKSSTSISVSSSTTSSLVGSTGSTVVYVCGITGSLTGSGPTVTFKTGTQTTLGCDTGSANLTGAITPSATQGMMSLHSGNGTIMKGIAGGQVCVTTGATTSFQGVLSYVQQ